jgi:hypothetical protein
MKLEAGKYYRCVGGMKAHVVAVNDEAHGDECAIGWIRNEKGIWECYWWSKEGIFDGTNDYNIISEWTDEPEAAKCECQKCWCNSEKKPSPFLDGKTIAEFDLEKKEERWAYVRWGVIKTDADGVITKENLHLAPDAPNELSDMRFYEGRIRLEPME